MNKDIIKGNWSQMKGKIKQQWGKLTDDDITRVEGNADELYGIMQEKYGYDKDRVEKEFDDFVKRNNWH